MMRIKILTSVLFVILSLTVVTVSATGMSRGTIAPNFTLKSASGENLRLSEYRGQVVMLNFWATWCGPCRQEMPILNDMYKRYKNKGFVLLGVNIDDDQIKAKAMLDNLKITFPVVFDHKKSVSKTYKVDAMPNSIMIDRDGKVQYIHRGYLPGYEKKYRKQVRELLRR
ncbi:MAG: TlpA disulfide reductase family protein [Gammaproteobacteria bacterium]|nr:MAG: TlpA disulfide reductase family protein [Gammaproteobacteria bacterium]